MSDDDSILVEGPEEFYRLLLPHHSKMRVENVGTAAFFFAGMREFTDPNVCSCMKGDRRKKSIWSMYRTLPNTMKAEQMKFIHDIFGGPILLEMEGELLGRLE